MFAAVAVAHSAQPAVEPLSLALQCGHVFAPLLLELRDAGDACNGADDTGREAADADPVSFLLAARLRRGER